MSDNVFNINGKYINNCNDILESAKDHGFTSLVLVGHKENGEVVYGSANIDSMITMLGTLDLAKHHIVQTWANDNE